MLDALRSVYGETAAANSEAPEADSNADSASAEALFQFFCRTEPTFQPPHGNGGESVTHDGETPQRGKDVSATAGAREQLKCEQRLALLGNVSASHGDLGAFSSFNASAASYAAVAEALSAVTVGRAAAASFLASTNRQQGTQRVSSGRLSLPLLSAAQTAAAVLDMDRLRSLSPLDALLPSQAYRGALAARKQQHKASSDRCDDEKEGDEEEEGEEGPKTNAKLGRTLDNDAPSKRTRTEQDSHPPTTCPTTRVTVGLSPPPQRGRSHSRSPPPPALRHSAKNSFAFSVRVAPSAATDGATRARSPLPPHSTVSHTEKSSSSNNSGYQNVSGGVGGGGGGGGGVGVAAEGGTSQPRQPPYGDMNDPLHDARLQQQQQQQTASSSAALRQSTLNFGGGIHSNSSNDNCGHYGGYNSGYNDYARNDEVNRHQKRFAPGGYNDSQQLQQQQQQLGDRRPYFGVSGRSAPNLSPPSRTSSYGSPHQQQQQSAPSGGFVSAGEQLVSDIKVGRASAMHSSYVSNRSPALGLRRGTFQPPFQPSASYNYNNNDGVDSNDGNRGTVSVNKVLKAVAAPNHNSSSGGKRISSAAGGNGNGNGNGSNNDDGRDDEDDDEKGFPASLLNPDGTVPDILKPLEPKLVAQVAMEILGHGAGARQVGWDDIAGLDHAKRSVEEAIVWPLLRPDIFVGLRNPPRGLLLFGPPGTGKTMIARAIANRAKCTFMNISSSSIMSKWMGEGEKLVRCMFAVATVKQPCVIFIDEIDSLLSMRGEGETDSVRRVKTEFLVQLDGVATDRGDRVLLIGATNRPDELDEAARRRMEKRLYIPLPDTPARKTLIDRLLSSLDIHNRKNSTDNADEQHKIDSSTSNNKAYQLDEADLRFIAERTEGYSGADLKEVCREAAMEPLRSVTASDLGTVDLANLRPIHVGDFRHALGSIKPSVGAKEVVRYVEWNQQFGSFTQMEKEDEAAE